MLPARLFRTESFRLTVLLAGLFVISSLVLAGAMFWVTERALTADFASSVQGNIAAVEEAFRNEGLPEAVEIVRQLTSTPAATDYYLLQDAAGAKLAGNLPAMAPIFARTELPIPDATGRREPEEHVIVGEGKRLPDGSYLFVGADSFELIEAREHTLAAFVLITGTTIALALLGGLALSNRVLKRTDAIIDVCRAIAADRWDQRVPVQNASRESDLLAVTINGMLDRLTALMENLRQVSTDIAHDLRTPLTHMRQRLERAQIEARTTEEYSHAIERALADSDELLRVFSSLLSLSQIEASKRAASFGEVDLSALLAHLAEVYRPVADDQGHKLETDLVPDVAVRGDRALLMQMFANLIENAIRHAGTRARLMVALGITRNAIVVEVCDTGRGISPADRKRAFDRFWRAEASRSSPGHGLGLSLVKAIADLHRIDVTLLDNGPGLKVHIQFPP
ncbi:MAG: hypothetical protein K1X51_08740 [Rhodospirillaceae bacterium]|nr:hypothetical protein [Rhodospirillaceae bacterium]